MKPRPARRAFGAPSFAKTALIATALFLTACPRTVEKGLPSCADTDVGVDESDADVDCARFPQLCDLPVASEPDPGGTPVDLVFVAAGGLRQGELGLAVDAMMERARANPRGIIGRDPQLFRVHVVDVPEPPFFGGDPLPACVDLDSRIVDFSSARVRLAVRSAPVAADVTVVLTPELRFPLREHARGGGIIALTFEGDALEHELGHALVGLGDEYTEFDTCCASRQFSVVVGDRGLEGDPNLTSDPQGGVFDGLAAPVEGGGRCARCFFHPEGPCEMEVAPGAFCPVCDRSIEARLHDFAPARHDDDEPVHCALGAERDPVRGADVRGQAMGLGIDRPLELVLVVGGVETTLESGIGTEAAFAVAGVATAGSAPVALRLTCHDSDESVVRTLAFR